MENVVLHVADVHKSFGGLRALADVDLEVTEGKTHAIIGPNGAGKSTLLNVCVGRLRPDTGSVVFNGQTLTGLPPYQINQMGVARVFQTPSLHLRRSSPPSMARRSPWERRSRSRWRSATTSRS